MKKYLFYLPAMALLLLCSGCADKYADIGSAQNDGAVLGECLLIDNVDVSGMTPEEASAALETAHTAALENLRYTVTAGDDTAHISGDMLPISFNSDETILQALTLKKHWPKNIEPRRLTTSMNADLEKLRTALMEHTAQLQYQPQDGTAAYSQDKGFTYTPHKDGRQLNYDKLNNDIHNLILNGEGGTVAAETSVIPAQYTTEMAQRDTGLISEFTTSFSGSTYGKANRVFNIVKAAAMIDGAVIAPGEEFDTNKTLGDRNKENGWKTAAGIRDGAYVQEYGGGVCQVSTTLYNAALMADLKITERHHHSWPLGYVDIGRDATISTGGPNLKFINSGPVPIILSAITDEKEKTVTVRIYGRPLEDGIHIELTSKKTATLSSPGTETVIDPSLAPGESKTIRKARRGSVAQTHKLYYSADGELIDKVLVTEDKYRSISGIVNVGPEAETTAYPQ